MTTFAELADTIATLAADQPDRKAQRPAEWEGIAPHVLDGQPNTLLAAALTERGATIGSSWSTNAGEIRKLLSRNEIALTDAELVWVETIVNNEDHGDAWGVACRRAGDPPRDLVPTEDGLYGSIPESAYHGDRDSLSSSGGRLLLPPSCPALFRQALDHRVDKPEYDYGHAAHKYVLGVGEQVDVIDAPDWRTKAAREARDAAYAKGHIPLLSKQDDEASRMAEKVQENPLAAALLENGDPELSGYWHDPETGVRLRFRPDWLPTITDGRRLIVVDYKTTVGSGGPTQFAKSAGDFGYHCQAAWYLDGIAATTGVTDAAFLFIVQSKKPPYIVTLVELDAEAIDLGRRLNRRSINLYADCVANDHWPDYGTEVHRVALPSYTTYQQEESLAS